MKAEIDNLKNIISDLQHDERGKSVVSGVLGEINTELKEKGIQQKLFLDRQNRTEFAYFFFLYPDDKIEQMNTELSLLRKQVTRIQKKISIYLTSYHKIDEDVVTVSGNSISTKGIFLSCLFHFGKILSN